MTEEMMEITPRYVEAVARTVAEMANKVDQLESMIDAQNKLLAACLFTMGDGALWIDDTAWDKAHSKEGFWAYSLSSTGGGRQIELDVPADSG